MLTHRYIEGAVKFGMEVGKPGFLTTKQGGFGIYFNRDALTVVTVEKGKPKLAILNAKFKDNNGLMVPIEAQVYYRNNEQLIRTDYSQHIDNIGDLLFYKSSIGLNPIKNNMSDSAFLQADEIVMYSVVDMNHSLLMYLNQGDPMQNGVLQDSTIKHFPLLAPSLRSEETFRITSVVDIPLEERQMDADSLYQ